MVKFYLRLSILLFALSFIHTPTQAADNKPGHGKKAETKSAKTTTVKKQAVQFKGLDGPNENINALQVFMFDSASTNFLPVALTGLNEETKKKLGGFDPVRFRMQTDNDSMVIGKEIEIKIIAEFLDVNPQLMFSFEGANEYTLKVLLPYGFVVTGGTYYDYIQGKVDKFTPKQEYTIKGYFESDLDKCFTLLRSHKNAHASDLYVKKAEKCFSPILINSQVVKNESLVTVAGVCEKISIEAKADYYPGSTTVVVTFIFRHRFSEKRIKEITNFAINYTAGCQPWKSASITLPNPSPANTSYAILTFSEPIGYGEPILIQGVSLTANYWDNDPEPKTCTELNPYGNPDANSYVISASTSVCNTCYGSLQTLKTELCGPTEKTSLKIVDALSNTQNVKYYKRHYVNNVISWEHIGTVNRSQSQSFTLNNVDEGIYRAEIGTQCRRTNEINIKRSDPNISRTEDICNGQPVAVTALGCEVLSGYIWSNGDTHTEYSQANKLLGVGEYYVNCINSTCPPQTDFNGRNAIVIKDLGKPTVKAVITKIRDFCDNTRATLSVSNCPGAVRWSNGETESSIDVLPGVYTAACENSCGTGPESVSVTVKNCKDDLIEIKAGLSTLCPNTTTYLSRVSGCPSGPVTYQKKNGGWAFFGSGSGADYGITGVGVGTYRAFCGTESSIYSNEVEITSSASPQAPIITFSDGLDICGGKSVTLTASGCDGGVVHWSNGQTGASIVVSTAGNYTAVCKTRCDNSDITSGSSNTVTVTSSGTCNCNTIVLSGNDVNGSINEGETLALTATDIAGVTYHWSYPAAAEVQVYRNQLYIYNIKPGSSGEYKLIAECDGNKVFIRNINVIPINQCAINFPTNAGSTSTYGEVSVGEKFMLYAAGGDTYEWTGPAGFYSTDRWPTRESAQLSHSGVYNVKISKTVNGMSCSTTLPVTVSISPCKMEASPHFVETSDKFTLYVQTNVDMANGSMQWFKNGVLVSTGRWHEMAKNDANRGEYKMIATYQTCTVEKTLYVDYSAPPAYEGQLQLTSCDRIEGYIVDQNNKSKSLQYTIKVQIDNNVHDLLITTAGNGQATSFGFDVPSRYKDGLKHTVTVLAPNGYPIYNTTDRSFRCCSLDFTEAPAVVCDTLSQGATIISNAVNGSQYRFKLEKQERNEDGESNFLQVADWSAISASGSKTFAISGDGNYRISVRDGNDTDACKTSVVVPVACRGDSTCAPPVVTVFPAGTIREGQGITPKFYGNAIPFNPSSEKGGLVMNGATSMAFGDYDWMYGNFTLEALVNPDKEAITVGDISEAGKQRYLFKSWNYGNNMRVSASLSVGSNGINLIEEGYNYKRLVLTYEGAIAGWNHIAVVYKANKASLYINGSLVKASNTAPPLNMSVNGPHMSGSYGNSGFKGSIYAMRIWATALEPSVVSQLKNNYTTTLAIEPNVGFWLFDKAILQGGYVEDLSTHKRKAYIKGGGFVLPLASPAVSPNAPVITWWLNGIKVGTGESYSMPREKVKEGTLNYTAKYEQTDGTFCETNFPVIIQPINFGSLSGCYYIKSVENNHPMTPHYSPGENHYRMRIATQQQNSEHQIWQLEHLGSEVYRINSAFYTDMALEDDGYYLKLKDKRTSTEAQKFKALVRDAGQMIFSFSPQTEPTKTIKYNFNFDDPLYFWEQFDEDNEKFKLVPTACPLPPMDCNVNGKITYERWLQPSLFSMSSQQFDNIDVKAYINDNPASYVSVQDFGGLKMHSDILDNLNSPPKPNNWPNPDNRWIGRLSGYFCPPQNGDYYFFARTHEWAELWISTDEDPRNKKLVSSCYGSCSDFEGQRSPAFAMSKGRSYYVELIYRQNGGGMMAEVAMVTPGNFWLDNNHQPMPLTNFSSIARDITPGYLTISANKPKVAPTENVTITASGCYFGRVVWRAGTRIIENPAATIPSITEVGPGYYQAICVGDPTVTQDWVTVMIDPITDIVPIPTGPAYACASQSITLTGTAAPSGYTYKWYVLKPAEKEYFFSNRSSTNLFENAPQIFNITQNANVTVTGPGLYFLQCISPNGWKSQVREFKVDTVFAAGLKAFNNGPIEPGNPLVLSTGAVPAATSYAWTGPNGFTASTRIATINSFADSLAGTYHLTITATGGCTFTDSTVVEASSCDIYVLSRAANGDTTAKLTRIGNSLDQFQPLTLTVSPFEGTNNFSGYKIQWMYNGSAVTGATSKTLTASKPGEYRAVLTLKSNAATICEAVTNLFAAPCKIYELDLSCQVPNNITLPNAVATGVQLAVGDEFTAGDYTVVVTEIVSGSPTGWKGKGYVKMKLVTGIVLKQISVNFDNAVVNECYELASGSVVTDYDPNWGGILDADAVISDVKNIIDKLTDLVENFTGSPEEAKKICDGLSEIEAGLPTNTTLSQFQKENAINYFGEVKTEWNNTCYACGSNSSNPNLRSANTTCSVEAFKTKYSIFTFVVNATADACDVDLTQLPTDFGNLKEGMQITLAGTFGKVSGGSPMTPPPCSKTFILYKRTSSQKLDSELVLDYINKANIGWLEESHYHTHFKPLVEAIANLTGTFYGPSQRESETLKRSADLINDFFNSNQASQFDDAFFSVYLDQNIKADIQNRNLMVSGTANPVYIESEILDLGFFSIIKNIGSKFAQKSFRILAELGKAKIKNKVSKELIANVDNGIIDAVTPNVGTKAKQTIHNEILKNEKKGAVLIVENGSKLSVSTWDFILKALIPGKGVPIKKYWGATYVTDNGKTLALESSVQGKLKAAIQAATSTKELGDVVEEVISDEINAIIVKQLENETGLKIINARYGSNNGIDLILADSDVADEVTRCIIVEIKATKATKNMKWKFGETGAGNLQMTLDWFEEVMGKLPPDAQGRALLNRIVDQDPTLVTDKIATFVDGEGNTKILRLH